MASIRRRRRARRDVWFVDYRDARGVRHRLTAPTKEAAQGLLGLGDLEVMAAAHVEEGSAIHPVEA